MLSQLTTCRVGSFDLHKVPCAVKNRLDSGQIKEKFSCMKSALIGKFVMRVPVGEIRSREGHRQGGGAFDL